MRSKSRIRKKEQRCHHLVNVAGEYGLRLRENCNCVAPRGWPRRLDAMRGASRFKLSKDKNKLYALHVSDELGCISPVKGKPRIPYEL